MVVGANVLGKIFVPFLALKMRTFCRNILSLSSALKMKTVCSSEMSLSTNVHMELQPRRPTSMSSPGRTSNFLVIDTVLIYFVTEQKQLKNQVAPAASMSLK